MEVQKQVDYWVNSANEDIETSRILYEKQRYSHSLFFCHLAVEKILKAVFVKQHNDFAPKTHNLLYLSELSDVDIDDSYKEFFAILMKYQIEGRYPDNSGKIIEKETVRAYFEKTIEAATWLKKKYELL